MSDAANEEDGDGAISASFWWMVCLVALRSLWPIALATAVAFGYIASEMEMTAKGVGVPIDLVHTIHSQSNALTASASVVLVLVLALMGSYNGTGGLTRGLTTPETVCASIFMGYFAYDLRTTLWHRRELGVWFWPSLVHAGCVLYVLIVSLCFNTGSWHLMAFFAWEFSTMSLNYYRCTEMYLEEFDPERNPRAPARAAWDCTAPAPGSDPESRRRWFLDLAMDVVMEKRPDAAFSCAGKSSQRRAAAVHAARVDGARLLNRRYLRSTLVNFVVFRFAWTFVQSCWFIRDVTVFSMRAMDYYYHYYHHRANGGDGGSGGGTFERSPEGVAMALAFAPMIPMLTVMTAMNIFWFGILMKRYVDGH